MKIAGLLLALRAMVAFERVLQDNEDITDAYDAVRSDTDETSWLILKYDGKEIVLSETGTDINDCFDGKVTDDERAYMYIRIEIGDEMTRRAKFAFITWIGAAVAPLKKAKVSTDKAYVKEVISTLDKEFLMDDYEELTLAKIEEGIMQYSGANYGTGSR